jgi:exodeoxyribonuclease III
MKIASFNINDINRRLENLIHWLQDAQPDVVCLQELKAVDTDFPEEALRQAGYHAAWRGEKRWNGVAILARWAPVVTRTDLPGDPADAQCRYLEAAINGVLVASIYAPNGNPQPGPKFDYKLAWLKRLNAHAAELYATGAPVVLAGDYNVVPTDLDIYPSKSWDRNALLQPESRAEYQALLAQGWTDAVRALHPKDPMYTFWDYMRQRWERDGGLRLDHILLSSTLSERLHSGGVDRQTRGMENASDHAPVWVKLRDGPGRLGAASRQASRQTVAEPRCRRGKPRSYHALPKTIRRSDGRAAGAILGFANIVLRLYSDEQPRAVVVGWDTLEAPTKRANPCTLARNFPPTSSRRSLVMPARRRAVIEVRRSTPFSKGLRQSVDYAPKALIQALRNKLADCPNGSIRERAYDAISRAQKVAIATKA